MNRPITIDGALRRMSLMKRMMLETFSCLPYSARYVPARMPIGVPMMIASTVSTRLPTIGLRSPPACPGGGVISVRSEEHTSELQSHLNLVCRLLLEKKKINKTITMMFNAPHCELDE